MLHIQTVKGETFGLLTRLMQDAALAVTGVIPNGDESFAPWLVGTDAINRR